jgi:hypothetical protein
MGPVAGGLQTIAFAIFMWKNDFHRWCCLDHWGGLLEELLDLIEYRWGYMSTRRMLSKMSVLLEVVTA